MSCGLVVWCGCWGPHGYQLLKNSPEKDENTLPYKGNIGIVLVSMF